MIIKTGDKLAYYSYGYEEIQNQQTGGANNKRERMVICHLIECNDSF